MAYWVLKVLLSPIMVVLWRVRTDGRRYVPTKGPVILAPNHVAFCDSLFLPLVLRRKVTFVAKAEYFDSWRTGWFFRVSGQIPMRREGGTASERALAAASDVLAAGRVLGIYPEGTRSPDGRLYRGHTGPARLALATGAPLVPVAVLGTPAVQPVGARYMRPFRRVTVRFGKPLDLDRFTRTAADDPLVLRRVTDELMFEIQLLSSQQYVDRYAKKHHVVGGADPAVVRSVAGDPAGPDRAPVTRASAGQSVRPGAEDGSRSEPEVPSQGAAGTGAVSSCSGPAA